MAGIGQVARCILRSGRTRLVSTPWLLAVLFGSSLFAVVVGCCGGRCRLCDLPSAGEAALETLGTGMLFLGFNVTVVALVVFALRAVGGTFVSIYVVIDPMLVLLSLLQGLVFTCWRRGWR